MLLSTQSRLKRKAGFRQIVKNVQNVKNIMVGSELIQQVRKGSSDKITLKKEEKGFSNTMKRRPQRINTRD